MSQIVLHNSNTSEASWRLRIALSIKNIDYKKAQIDENIKFDDSKNTLQNYIKLEIDGKTIQGGALSTLEYLEEAYH